MSASNRNYSYIVHKTYVKITEWGKLFSLIINIFMNFIGIWIKCPMSNSKLTFSNKRKLTCITYSRIEIKKIDKFTHAKKSLNWSFILWNILYILKKQTRKKNEAKSKMSKYRRKKQAILENTVVQLLLAVRLIFWWIFMFENIPRGSVEPVQKATIIIKIRILQPTT